MPASTMPSTLVFLALESCSATPYSPSAKPDLLEPGQRPAGVGVEVAFLLGQRLVEGLVDQRQRLAHGERLALGVEHLGVAGIDRHAGADGGLRQVHRRDVAALQMRERLRQLGLERGDELAARGGGCIGGALAADEDDAGGEGIGARCRSCGCSRSVRIGQVPLMAKPASNHCIQKGLPASTGGAVVAIALGLLESVVDGDREGRMCLLGESVHRLRHAVEEERLCLLLAAVAIGRGHQFLGLRHGKRGEEIRERRASVSDAARRRRSPTDPRSRYCRSRADQWKRLLSLLIAKRLEHLHCLQQFRIAWVMRLRIVGNSS